MLILFVERSGLITGGGDGSGSGAVPCGAVAAGGDSGNGGGVAQPAIINKSMTIKRRIVLFAKPDAQYVDIGLS